MLAEFPVLQDLSIFRKIPFNRSFTRDKLSVVVGLSHSFPISWATSIEGHLKEPESSSEEGAIVSVSSHEGHPYMAVKTTRLLPIMQLIFITGKCYHSSRQR